MILTALVLAAPATAPGRTDLSGSMPVDYWRNPRRCRSNRLYAYLSLHGHPASIEAIAVRASFGSNMADLRVAATES